MPFSQTPPFAGLGAGGVLQAVRHPFSASEGAHRIWRVLLLALGMLVPLNLPFSVPPLGRTARPGWFATSVSDVTGAPGLPIVMTRVSRKARSAGVLPGDRLLALDGEVATAALLLRREAALRPGDTVRLRLERRGLPREVVVEVDAPTVGYRTYTAYVVFVAYLCWLVGMAVVARHGHMSLPLLFGAALLLVPPVGFAGGVPGDGLLLRMVRALWQWEASAFRVFLPAFLVHALLLQRGVRLARSAWLAGYAALGLVLVGVTHGGKDLLAWTQPGPAQAIRLATGLTLEVGAVATALHLIRRPGGIPEATMRLVVGAVALAMASAAAYSATRLAFGGWFGEEFVSGLNSVAMFGLPAALAVHYLRPARLANSATRAWRATRLTATGVSVGIAGVHALVIAASVAVVLNGSGQDLGGVEWLLFVTVVTASVLPAPALRWLGAMADRRLVAHWVRVEEDAQAFIADLSGELDPERIGERVADALPRLLDVASAALEGPECAPREGQLAVPVPGSDRRPIAMLMVGGRRDGTPTDPPTRVLLTTIANGIGAALTAARASEGVRRFEAELAEAERIASLGALTGGLAHAIKNPLAGLRMAVHLLDREGADPSRLQRIEQDVRRIDDLVSGLLRLTSGNADVPGPDAGECVDLRTLAAACVADLRPGAEDRGISLREAFPDEVLTVSGPPLPYRLILLNLVANAIESVGSSGTVRVGLESGPGVTVLTVADNGPGVPDGVRDRIFDLHFTTKRHGTGIGLALVRHEAERLGGTVSVAETSPAGTTMRVVLPRPVPPRGTPSTMDPPHAAAAIPAG